MKKISILFGAAFAMLLSSCSGDEYLNTIPKGSTALVSVDPAAMVSAPSDQPQVLETLLHLSAGESSGIDPSSKYYLFVSPDGNLGMTVRVEDSRLLEKQLNDLSKKGVCQPVTERKDIHYTFVDDKWVVGFNDQALLMLGPVVAARQTQTEQQIARYLRQDKKAGITESRMFQKLDSIPSAIAMVAQVAALPEQFAAPLMLGAPKTADASQVLIAASLQAEDQVLCIQGAPFSFNTSIDRSLKAATEIFRPMEGRFVNNLHPQAVLSLLTQVQGSQFLPLLQENKALNTLLMGVNTAIDMNSVIRSVDGDLLLSLNTIGEGRLKMVMGAQMGNTDFWKQADYWRKTAPRDFQFTLDQSDPSQKAEFLCGNEPVVSLSRRSEPAMNASVVGRLKGQRLCMVLNLHALDEGLSQTVSSFLTPLFGQVSTLIYSLDTPQTDENQTQK